MKTPLILLSKEEFVEKYSDVLSKLEFCVVSFYRQHPVLHDHDVLHLYELLLKYIKAKLTDFPLPQVKLEGVAQRLYEGLFNVIQDEEKRYSLKELQECVKTLEKSLKFWNREHGSRGYLNYVSQLI